MKITSFKELLYLLNEKNIDNCLKSNYIYSNFVNLWNNDKQNLTDEMLIFILLFSDEATMQKKILPLFKNNEKYYTLALKCLKQIIINNYKKNSQYELGLILAKLTTLFFTKFKNNYDEMFFSINRFISMIEILYDTYGKKNLLLINLLDKCFSMTDTELKDIVKNLSDKIRLICRRNYIFNFGIDVLQSMSQEDIEKLPLDMENAKNRRPRFHCDMFSFHKEGRKLFDYEACVLFVPDVGNVECLEVPDERYYGSGKNHINKLSERYDSEFSLKPRFKPTALMLIGLRKFNEIAILVESDTVSLILPKEISEEHRTKLLSALSDPRIEIGELGIDVGEDEFLSLADSETANPHDTLIYWINQIPTKTKQLH